MTEIKYAKEIAEQAKKIEAERKRVKEALNKMETDARLGRTEYLKHDSTDLKYAKQALDRAQSELDRLKRWNKEIKFDYGGKNTNPHHMFI